MKIPAEIFNHKEWTLVGPMGPILANSYLLSLPILSVDGGAHFCERSLIWIGDSDSSSSIITADYQIELNPNKDFSDLKAAFDLFPSQMAFKLHLWGFLGGRQDHHLINLGETYKAIKLRMGSIASFYDENGKISMMMTSMPIFTFNHHGVFSLISFEPTDVKLTGHCEYQLITPISIGPLSSHGLSNRADGEVTLTTDKPILIVLGDS